MRGFQHNSDQHLNIHKASFEENVTLCKNIKNKHYFHKFSKKYYKTFPFTVKQPPFEHS